MMKHNREEKATERFLSFKYYISCLSTNYHFAAFVLIVTGTTVNYFLDDKINRADILFPGVGCFLVAVCLGSAVHSSNTADNKAKLDDFPSDYTEGAMYVSCSFKLLWDVTIYYEFMTNNTKMKKGSSLFCFCLELKSGNACFGIVIALLLIG